MSTKFQFLLFSLAACLFPTGNLQSQNISTSPDRYKTIPGHGMSNVEYPFDVKGFYRTDWVDPRGKSKVASSTTVRGPLAPPPVDSPVIPVTFRIKSDEEARSFGYIGPYSKMNPAGDGLIDAWYKVKKGDTLTAIARKFQTSVDEIKKTNDLTKDLILVGQSLRLALARHALGIAPE